MKIVRKSEENSVFLNCSSSVKLYANTNWFNDYLESFNKNTITEAFYSHVKGNRLVYSFSFTICKIFILSNISFATVVIYGVVCDTKVGTLRTLNGFFMITQLVFGSNRILHCNIQAYLILYSNDRTKYIRRPFGHLMTNLIHLIPSNDILDHIHL